MKILNLAVALGAMLSMVSCIQDEPLNAECDITAVTLPGDVLNREPIIGNDKVTLIIKNEVSLLQPLAPEFTLTPGATIDPPSGTPRMFAEEINDEEFRLIPQTYTVTSQDGEWSKTYTVEVQQNNVIDGINLKYEFENVRLKSALGGLSHYDEFYETSMIWASANSAFALSFQASTPDTYPTYQGDEGKTGKCVVLTTRSTGSWGEKLKKPIAAGNLFIGTFESASAVSHPLEATHFGSVFYREPTWFSGFYKYKPGETYCETDADGRFIPVPGKTDMFNLYIVMYEVTPEMQWLDGTNVLSKDNPNIIGTAEIPDRHASDEWVEFGVPFQCREGKTIDPDKLKDGAYNMAVVMSSSQDGDYFSGAIGSTLMVDELLITFKDK
ncbi:MAG: PCMD domain-containing protein [Muribaculaceae bacterium]|nr:PCMD domain-containing protein [Muribaculaceae bacterium]